MRGSFKGRSGKVDTVLTRKCVVYLESMQQTKKDGTKVNVSFHTSNLQITEWNLEDNRRLKKTSVKKSTELSKEKEKENKADNKKNKEAKK